MKILKFLLALAICSTSCNGLSLSYTYLKYFKHKAIEMIDLAIPKGECSRHLKALIGDVFNLKKIWALKMLDASSKLQPGFLSGNVFHFGSYDQCLSITEDKGSDGIIEGQYCTVAISPAKNSSNDLGQILDFSKSIPEIMGIERSRELSHIIKYVRMVYGICLPKSCTADSLQKLWDHLEFTFRLPVHVSASDDFCIYKGKTPFVFEFDYLVWCLFGIYLSIVILISLYDKIFMMEYDDSSQPNMWFDMLSAFSIQRNSRKIWAISPNANEDTKFSCFHGIKAISMLWIIYGHKFVLGSVTGIVNMMFYFEWRETVGALLVIVNPFAVDTFLVISGLLITYKSMQVRDLLLEGEKFPYLMYYLMRFLRLWPALFATILFYTSVMKYLSDGPMWSMVSFKSCLTCRYTGWGTALFITNFFKFHSQCIEPTWYLAVDTQLYFIAPLLLYFLNKHPRRSTFFCLILFLCSTLWAYYVTIVYKEKWLPAEGDDQYQMKIYQSTFTRMSVWIIGLLVGRFLYIYPNIKFSENMVNLFWSLSTIILSGIVLVNYLMANSPYNEYHSALYNSATRPLWGVAMSLIIVLCATGHGGKVNKLLSLKYFKPLARISYSTFLTHCVVIKLLHGGKRVHTFHSNFQIFLGFLGDLPLVLTLSFFWCLFFESPFIRIAKIIIKYKEGTYNIMEIALPEKCKEKKRKSRDEYRGKNGQSRKMK